MVVLRYYEDLSEAQTAEVLGVSVGTVKSAVSRAFGKLREDPELSPCADDAPAVHRSAAPGMRNRMPADMRQATRFLTPGSDIPSGM
jgi:hypothetical protein